MNPLRRIALALSGAMLLATTAACGPMSASASSATYTPAAYYQTVGGVADCYYVDTSAEVADLISAGLCPVRSVATRMPLSWEEEYWSYYSSPAYYDDYMPVSYRKTYASVTVVHFSSTYSKQIKTASVKATYKSSTGKTVSGAGTSSLKYGTSTAKSKTVHGGGSGTVSSCSLAMTTLVDKSGTSSSSHGGGSGSKSSTTSKTKTSSGSKGGC